MDQAPHQRVGDECLSRLMSMLPCAMDSSTANFAKLTGSGAVIGVWPNTVPDAKNVQHWCSNTKQINSNFHRPTWDLGMWGQTTGT